MLVDARGGAGASRVRALDTRARLVSRLDFGATDAAELDAF
jgi:hypothetical protein